MKILLVNLYENSIYISNLQQKKKSLVVFFLRRTNLIFPTSYTRCKCLRDVSVKHGKFTVQKLSYQKREWQKSQILNIVGNEYSLTGENDFKRRQKEFEKGNTKAVIAQCFLNRNEAANLWSKLPFVFITFTKENLLH